MSEAQKILMTRTRHVNLVHLFNILKGRGGYISKMTQDAKLGHMLNVAVCTGQEEGDEIIITQNANYDHMFKVLQRRVTEL